MKTKSEIVEQIKAAANVEIARLTELKAVRTAILKGAEKVRHHKQYGARVAKSIKEALIEAFPEDEHRLVVSTCGHSAFNLSVWNVAGLTYDTRQSFGWYLTVDSNPVHWFDQLRDALGKGGLEESLNLCVVVCYSASRIADLEVQIHSLRGQAREVSKDCGRFGFPYFLRDVAPNVYGAER